MEQKKVSIIHYIIVALFCFGFRFIPGFAGITPLGMGILGTFIGAVYGWVMIDMLWPSLMALVGIGLSIGMNQMMAASFGSSTIVCLIVSMMVVGVAMKNGAFVWLATAMLNSKAFAGKGYLTIFAIFVIAWLVGSFNPIIMCVIFCGFLTAMFKQVGVKKDEPVVIFTFLGVAYQLMRGQILFPFTGTGLVYLNMARGMFPDVQMPVPQYLLMMIIMGIVMALVFIALMKFVFRVDVSAISNYKVEGKVPACTKSQKISLILFVIFILLNILAVMGPLAPFLHQFDVVGIAIIMGCLVPLIKDENSKPLGNLEELLHMVNWGQITLVGYIMVIATYMTTPDTGISTAMSYVFRPFMTLPPIVFIIVVMVIATILTNIANNMIVTALAMPFLVNFAAQVGMNPIAMIALLFIISEFALATPAASPVTAVAFSQEMVSPNKMTAAALKILPFLFVVFLIIGWPLAQIIF